MNKTAKKLVSALKVAVEQETLDGERGSRSQEDKEECNVLDAEVDLDKYITSLQNKIKNLKRKNKSLLITLSLT